MYLRFLHDAGNLLLVSLKAGDQVLLERSHAVGQEPGAVENVADDERLVDVELELAVHATDSSSHLVTHDLSANHGQGLALSWVDLARHDAATRLVLREDQLAETTTRAATEVTNILSDLGQGRSQSVEAAVGLDKGVVGGKGLELVGGSLELSTGHLADLLSNALGETLESVDASADSGTTLSEQAKIGQGGLDTLDTIVKLSDVSRELLGQGQRGSILEMGASNLDDLLGFEIVNLGLDGGAEAAESGEEVVLELEDGSNVHDGGEGVVGGGAAVDVVVGVDGLLAAHLSAQNLNGSVGDDLVGVHVGLGAGAGLPDDEGEVVEELAVGDFLGSLLDSLSDLGV